MYAKLPVLAEKCHSLRDQPVIPNSPNGIFILSGGLSNGCAFSASTAPDAVQVADRWHLLQNLRDALIRVLEQNRGCLQAAAAEPNDDPEPKFLPEMSTNEEKKDETLPTRLEQTQQATRERRLARYQTVIDLHEKGVNIRAIARELGIGRSTVRRYIKAGSFPEMDTRRERSSILDPFLPHLEKRWAKGCHNGLQLYREIEQQGYLGSRPLVSRWAAQMRKQEPKHSADDEKGAKPKMRVKRAWSARYAVWLLLSQPETLSDEKQAALERMLAIGPMIRRVYNFAQAFIRIVRDRQSKSLRPWLTAVIDYIIPGLSGFARSLNRDKDAVLAALYSPWSNGRVEGQVNRLKLTKRQMYGRAKFDLHRLTKTGLGTLGTVAFTEIAEEPVFDCQGSSKVAEMALFSVIKWPCFQLTKTSMTLSMPDICVGSGR
jgi:transposase